VLSVPRLYGGRVAGLDLKAVDAGADSLVAYTEEGVYQLWTRRGETDLAPLGAAGARDGAKAYSPDGRRAALSDRGLLTVYDGDTGAPLAAFKGEARHTQVLWSPEGGRLLCVDALGNIAVVEAATGRALHTWPAAYTASPFQTVACPSPDWALAAVNNPGHIGGMYDLATYEKLYDFPGPYGALGLDGVCAFSGDGQRLYAGVYGQEILVLAARTGEILQRLPYRPTYGMALSPDGTRLAFGGAEGLFVVDEAGGLVWQGEADIDLHGSLAWSPEGKYLAAGETQQSRTKIFDAATGQPLWEWEGDSPAFAPAQYLLLRRQRVGQTWNPLLTDYEGVLYDLETGKIMARLPQPGVFDPRGDARGGAVLMQDALWRMKPLAQLMAEARRRLGGRRLTAEDEARFFLD
jgi:WD40 repeat protein